MSTRHEATLHEDEDEELRQHIECMLKNKYNSPHLRPTTSPTSPLLNTCHAISSHCRNRITERMTSLDYPASSSDEDGLTDDMASTGDEIDDDALTSLKSAGSASFADHLTVESE